jgi:hypothetical protein
MDAQELRNLQEAYLEVYDEAYKKFPYKKVEDKIHKKEADNPTGRGTPQSVNMGKVLRHFKGEVRRTERRENSPKISKAKEAENRERGTQKEQVDLYDIILSYLLDEGYADTFEAAEAIMVNMSEDWREDIVEEKKSLPVAKMKRKETKLLGSDEEHLAALKTPMGSPERKKAMKNLERFDNINTARTSISKRGGKETHAMPEVGRYKPKY